MWEAPADASVIVQLPAGAKGEVYVTQDGSDPRVIGGGISDTAHEVEPGKPVNVAGVVLKTRTKNGDDWSALRELYFVRPIARSELEISEIQYHANGDKK